MTEGLLKISKEVKNSFIGVEIYDIKLSKIRGDYYIKIELDDLNNKNGSVSLATCEAFSKSFIVTLDQKILENNSLETQLPTDLTVDNYTLEVSSAGAEREIRFPEELERFKESPLKVVYLENNKKRSKILNYISKQNQSEFVFLEYYTKKEKKNQKEKKYISINEKDIIRINLYLDF
ncbi:MAG: hypothetical protein ACK4UJ_06025 [Leptonema sp. (in: bacteria)]